MEGTLVKTIGLIGGMSWESTVKYYRIINEEVKEDWVDYIRQNVFYTALILMKSSAFNRQVSGRKQVNE